MVISRLISQLCTKWKVEDTHPTVSCELALTCMPRPDNSGTKVRVHSFLKSKARKVSGTKSIFPFSNKDHFVDQHSLHCIRTRAFSH